MARQRKALALISGGLDSLLATRVVMDQGVHVEGINFYSGFCVEGHTHALRRQDQARPKRNNALWCDAQRVTVEVHDSGAMQTMEVVPMPSEQIPADWYL